MTSIPTSSPSIPAAPVGPPVLASAMLLEDVAPLRPAPRLLKTSLGAMAVVFAAWAALGQLGLSHGNGPVGATGSAVVALLLALLPIPYAARAALAVTVGLVPVVLGVLGDGPLAGLAGGSWRGPALLALVASLPGVLFFRARYRALSAARVLLAVAYVVSVPGLAALALGGLDGSAPLAWRVVDALVVAFSLAGAFGFMGAETTGMAGVWAAAVIAGLALRLGLRAPRVDVDALLAAAGLASAAMVVALGTMQLLAVWLAESARKVDVHKPVGPSEDEA